MNSPISWIGGKKLLRSKIISMFPSEGVQSYVEVFGGAGWVLFGREKHAPLEIYNDVDGSLINLFRCIKYHPKELQRQLQFSLNSREVFYDCRSQAQAVGLTDIQRAARFFLMIKISYGSDRRTFGCAKKNVIKMTDYLAKVSDRLAEVLIEHKSYDKLILQYDKQGALFYLDPPYHTTEKYYDGIFTDTDHHRLHDILRGLQGRFVLSYNDDAFVQDLYQGFKITEISRNNNLTARYAKGDKTFKELLIKNF